MVGPLATRALKWQLQMRSFAFFFPDQLAYTESTTCLLYPQEKCRKNRGSARYSNDCRRIPHIEPLSTIKTYMQFHKPNLYKLTTIKVKFTSSVLKHVLPLKSIYETTFDNKPAKMCGTFQKVNSNSRLNILKDNWAIINFTIKLLQDSKTTE
jgi:hypothetical protein